MKFTLATLATLASLATRSLVAAEPLEKPLKITLVTDWTEGTVRHAGSLGSGVQHHKIIASPPREATAFVYGKGHRQIIGSFEATEIGGQEYWFEVKRDGWDKGRVSSIIGTSGVFVKSCTSS
jgi:hypothetical protein